MKGMDFVLNFYEILSIVSIFRRVKKHSISNQYLIFHLLWEKEITLFFLLVYFWTYLTKFGSEIMIAPCFKYLPSYKDLQVTKPLINKDVEKLRPNKGNRILVYLFDKNLIEKFVDQIDPKEEYDLFIESTDYGFPPNVEVYDLSRKYFLNKLESCKKVICSGGFQLISEAKYLNKEVEVIPLHYEQRMNQLNLG